MRRRPEARGKPLTSSYDLATLFFFPSLHARVRCSTRWLLLALEGDPLYIVYIVYILPLPHIAYTSTACSTFIVNARRDIKNVIKIMIISSPIYLSLRHSIIDRDWCDQHCHISLCKQVCFLLPVLLSAGHCSRVLGPHCSRRAQ